MLVTSKLNPSPVQKTTFKGRTLWLKRDDLINPYFNGNKARKFKYYFEKDLNSVKKVASYGGNQSNAMYSLAAFSRIKNLHFDYYVKPLPISLKMNACGNLKYALELGMNLIELENYESFFQEMSSPQKNYDTLGADTLLIRQGAAENDAEYGVKELADEITEFAQNNDIRNLSVFIQSGTGTTALYLQKHLKFKVYTTPNIGNSIYLLKQFSLLENNSDYYPVILETEKKYVFGHLYKEYFQIWEEICEETGIEFELLYDPKTLIVLDEFLKNSNDEILYIHSGGIVGNESMLKRYKRYFNSLSL